MAAEDPWAALVEARSGLEAALWRSRRCLAEHDKHPPVDVRGSCCRRVSAHSSGEFAAGRGLRSCNTEYMEGRFSTFWCVEGLCKLPGLSQPAECQRALGPDLLA